MKVRKEDKIRAREEAERLERENKKDSFIKEVLDYIGTVVFVVVFVFLLLTYVVINARIPTSSMEETVSVNDRLFGNRLAYIKDDPERYDIIIFKCPDDESKLYIKRIIGLPGETLEIIDGKVYVNGASEPLRDDFCPETPTGSFGPYVIPEDCYFMMGDNRNHSLDARFWENTYLHRDKILGKAGLRYWPLTEIGFIK